MRCRFVEVARDSDGMRRHVCAVCKLPLSAPFPPERCHRSCNGETPGKSQRPGVLQRFRNLRSAYARWAAAGKPQRSAEEIGALLVICQGCEHFRDGACTLCGCPINRRKRWGNKLAWATEHCPVGKW